MEGWTTVGRRGRGRVSQHNREGRVRESEGSSLNDQTEKREKKYFKLLQAVHHAEVVDNTHQTNRFPAGMLRQVNKLTSFIKPSSPNTDTASRVRNNTEQWMKNNMNILKDHYDSVIALALQNLPVFDGVALEKAITYGRGRYKQRLTASSIATLSALVGGPRLVGGLGVEIGERNEGECLTLSPADQGSPSNNVGPSSHIGLAHTVAPTSLPPRPPRLDWPRRPTFRPASSSVPGSSPSFNPNPDLSPNLNLTHCPDPNPNPVPHPASIPNVGEPTQVVSEAEAGVNPQVGLMDIHQAACSSSLVSSLWPKVNFELNMTESLDLSGGDDLPGLGGGDVPCTSVVTDLQLLMEGGGEPALEGGAPPVRESYSPEGRAPTYQKPTLHCDTYHKKVQWSLEIRHPVLVVGDSNLSRFPEYQYPLVQIDSFPEAQIHHLSELLGKLDPCHTVQMVVLSVGLNNCLRGNELATIKKQFRRLVSRAKTVFPQAEIVVPLVHFSPRLQEKQRILLEKMNIFLDDTFPTLEGIQEAQFHTAQDFIHWTPASAEEILHSWMRQMILIGGPFGV